MRQAQNSPYGYAPTGAAPDFATQNYASPNLASNGQPVYGEGLVQPQAAAASSQRINGLREALTSIEQRIGGMTQSYNAQAAPRPHSAPRTAPYAQPHGGQDRPVETMQQQLNRLAMQVGQANTAMQNVPAAPRYQPQPQPQPQQQTQAPQMAAAQPMPQHFAQPLSQPLSQPMHQPMHQPAPQQVPQPAVQPSVDLSAITGQLDTLRQEIGALKGEVAKPVSVKTTVAQEEVDRIASAIAELQSRDRIDPRTFERLAGELDGLRSTMKSEMEDTVRRSMDAQADREIQTARSLNQKLDHIAHNLANSHKASLDADATETQLAGRIDELARQMEQLALHTASNGASRDSEQKRQDDIARRIDDLAQQIADSATQPPAPLVERLDELANQVAGLSTSTAEHAAARASDDTAEQLAARLDDLAAQLADSRSNGSALSNDLADRIESVRASVSDLPQTLAVGRIEQTLDDVTQRIEQLTEVAAASASAQNHLLKETAEKPVLSPDDLSQIEGRLDEIARAVVAVSNISREARHVEMPEIDLSGMDRLEARMTDLARTVDAMAAAAEAPAQRDPVLDDIAVRIEGLTDRLGSFEKYARSGDLGNASALLAAPDTGKIEEQLRTLTTRIEEAAAMNSTSAQIDNLEAQVAQMMAMLDRQPQPEPAAPVDLSPLENRLAGIESHLQQAPDLTVHAAQEAARQAIDMVGENSEQGQMVAALSDHLNQLQAMAANGSADTNQLHATLQAVMERLDAIEASVERSREMPQPVSYAANVPLPSASQLHDAPVENPYAHERRMAEQTDRTALAADTLLDAAHDELFAPTTAFVSAPSVDPSDDLAAQEATAFDEQAEDHAPLEPNGTGDPLAAFAPSATGSMPDDGVRPNAIAAARRALQATSEEMSATRDTFSTDNAKSGAKQDGKALDGFKAKLAALASKANSAKSEAEGDADAESTGKSTNFRKPVMIAAAAVLLALVAFQGVRMFKTGESRPETAQIELSANKTGASVADGVSTQPSVTLVSPDPIDSALQENADGDTVTVTTPAPAKTYTFGGGSDDETTAATTPTGAVNAAPATTGTPSQTEATRAGVQVAPDQQAAAPAAPEQTPPAADPVAYDVPEYAGSQALVAAARAGEPKALFEVGMRYSNGRGVTRDLKQAGTWFKAAAEEGFAPAQYSYGSLLEKGTDIERDVVAAASWYEKAAAQGNARAMHNLAVIHASGDLPDTKADIDRAVEWFKQAADYGIQDSQFNLGILYGQGMGLPQDLEQAYKWFAIAAKTGDADAASKRDQVAEAMGQGDLERAQIAVSNWKAKPVNENANRVTIPDSWKGRPGAPVKVDKEAVRSAQTLLNQRGFNVGSPDGLIGPKTTRAIIDFQKRSGIPVTGQVDKELLDQLKV